eukprot:SAG25_NODE_304_length_10125_cov_10.664273_6_plen_77_part_00
MADRTERRVVFSSAVSGRASRSRENGPKPLPSCTKVSAQSFATSPGLRNCLTMFPKASFSFSATDSSHHTIQTLQP